MTDAHATTLPSSRQSATDPLVVARDLVRIFGPPTAPVRAVDHVDITVARGELLSVMGPSGCGKSSLLHLLGGLDRPTSGVLHVAGTRVDQQSVTEWARFRRATIGFVFQSWNLVPNLTVRDNVLLPALLARGRDRSASRRADDLLERLGLGARAAALPGTLSGGEAQRAGIARALINEPALLLADEPTGALDSTATGEVIRLLREVNAEGVAMIVVTHDARVATIADRLLTMRDGGVVDETRLDGVSRAAFTDLLEPEESR